MAFEIDRRKKASIIALPKRVDLANVKAFADALQQALAEAAGAVILDCTQATVIDSTALGALVKYRRDLGEDGHRIVLAAVSDSVREVLQITRLNTVFSVFDSVEEAVTAASDEGS